MPIVKRLCMTGDTLLYVGGAGGVAGGRGGRDRGTVLVPVTTC